MAYKKHDQAVTDLVNGFGGANFADILNRLWMNGLPVDALKGALAQSVNGKVGTNDPSDIVTRLLNSGVATIDQIKAAPNSDVPTNAGFQWPFHPESKDAKGVVVPMQVAAPKDQINTLSGVTTAPVAPVPVTAPPAPPGTKPTPPPQVTNITNVTQTPTDKTLPEKTPVTPQEVTDYEAKHYPDMMWAKAVPDLADLLDKAAKGKWDPSKFTAELHATDWWKTNSSTMRKFTQDMASDPETMKKQIGTNATVVQAYASTMGVNIDDATAQQMGSDWIKFGWDDKAMHSQVLGHASSTDQLGTLGAQETTIHGMGKDWLSPVSNDEAFTWAKKIATGDMTMDNVTQALRSRAKGAFPTIADYIDNGGTPASYFHNHVTNAAQLLEVDPSTIDLTDPKYNQIVSFTDPTTGKARPMTLSESDRFIKSKDEYWTTENSQKEVDHLVSNIGSIMGREAV